MNKTYITIITCVLILLNACATRQVIQTEVIPTTKAQHEIDENQLLDVGVKVFDPGLPEKQEQLEEENIFPEVRKAEARYIPYALRSTLEETGYWGATRVIPSDVESVDLIVTGKIIASDGEVLTLEIRAQDATGREWLRKKYTGKVSRYAYKSKEFKNKEPFQNVYNSIANDLLQARKQLTAKDLRTIRSVSELKFAEDLSPHVYADHLKQDDEDRYTVNRLPAESDPMLQRIRKIRERDYLLIDTLDSHYANFHDDMRQRYQEWRHNSYDEVVALRELKGAARTRMLLGAATFIAGILGASQGVSSIGQTAGTLAVIGGAAVFKGGMDKYAESKIHADAFRELGESFDAEVAPKVLDVEGKTITLTGSAEEQYKEWRKLLREIYAAETGFIVTDQANIKAD